MRGVPRCKSVGKDLQSMYIYIYTCVYFYVYKNTFSYTYEHILWATKFSFIPKILEILEIQVRVLEILEM